MKSVLKWLAAVIAVFLLIIVTLFIVLFSLIDTEPYIASNSYLHIRLSGSLPEYIPPDALEEALGRSEMDLNKVRDLLEKAAVDDRVVGVVLELGYLQTGYAKLQELNDLIVHFRETTDKKIFAFFGTDIALTRDYYVASACDAVFMPPQSNLFITGVGSQITYYKSFFKKFGVQAQFLHVGTYKSAPERYTRDSMSNDSREVLSGLLDQYYSDLVQTISNNRGLESNQIKRLINEKTGFTGREAKNHGLIDSTLFFSDIADLFEVVETPVRLSAYDYAQIPASSLDIRNNSRVAVVYCSGTITSGYNSEDTYMGELAGARSLVNNLRRAARSNLNKAIILRIDSPGGSASASEVIWNAVREATIKKPLIVSISDYGASGGYYIGLPGDTVIAQPSSLVGSIGIFAGKFNFKGLYKLLDLNTETLLRGENADIFSILEPWSEDERKIVLHLLETYYQDFVAKVAESRNLNFTKASNLAEGRVWTGLQARQNGLIDLNGNFYDAVNIAKELADIDSSESVRFIFYPREKSFLNQLLSSVEARIELVHSLGRGQIDELVNELSLWQNKPLAMLPFRIKWE